MMGTRSDLHPGRFAVPLLGLFVGWGCGAGDPGEALLLEVAALEPVRPFDPTSIEGLPGPAQRFFRWAIQPETPLAHWVELDLEGEIRLQPEAEPLPLTAEQLLAPPIGFVWRARAGRGILAIVGFDRYGAGEGEMRWRLGGLIPVVNASGEDVTRSAAGRLAMEGVLLPSSLLPERGVTWEGVNDRSARFRMRVGDETVESTLEIDSDGRPTRISAMRWSEEADPGYDLFVVEFAGILEADGFRIPREMTAGWRVGAEDEFRFYWATLNRARFR